MDELDIRRLDSFSRQKRFAWGLGLSGLVPFLACAIVVVALGVENPLSLPAIEIFRNYSVVILSFLGGIRWGHALLRAGDEASKPESMVLCLSMLPPLLGWATMFLEAIPAVGILLVAFCAQGAWDSLSANANRLPKWFSPLRIVLTLAVAAAHIAIFLALLQRA